VESIQQPPSLAEQTEGRRGAGGSLAIIDMDARATYAYAMNKMGGGRTGDMRAFAPISAAWEALAGVGGPPGS
jgi:hypothetical protein